MNSLQIAVALLAVCSLTHSAPVDPAAHNVTQCLMTQTQRPFVELVQYSSVSGITRLRKSEAVALYRASLEVDYSVQFLSTKLGCRTGQSFPRPYHHCFLQERDATTFQYNSTDSFMHAQRLAADLCLLVPFLTPLSNAISYEEDHHAGEYTPQLRDIQTRFTAILEALSNITNIPLPNDDQSGGDEDVSVHPDDLSGSHRNSRQVDDQVTTPLTTPPVRTTAAISDGHQQSDYELLNQGRGRRQTQAEQAEGEVAEDRCSFPQTDNDQFIYIYELWIGLWYMIYDLKTISETM